jgi:hypothetical protein
MNPSRKLATCVLLACALDAGAFTICVEDEPFLPLLNGRFTPPGHAQILVEAVAKNLQILIRVQFAPWRRCTATIASGVVDAILAPSYAGKNIEIAVFPMLGPGQPDPSKAVGLTKTFLYRRKQTPPDFLNGRFVHLHTPVAIASGYQASADAVTKGGGGIDDGAKTVEQLAAKLLAGRVDLVAGDVAFAQLVNARYQDQLEALPTMLHESHYYLAFSTQYYRANQGEVEAFWIELAKVKNSAGYKASIK